MELKQIAQLSATEFKQIGKKKFNVPDEYLHNYLSSVQL